MRLVRSAALVLLGPLTACVSVGGLSGGGASDGSASDAAAETVVTGDARLVPDSAGSPDAGTDSDAAAEADAAITIPPGLVVWLRMEDSTGSTALNTAKPTLGASIGAGVTLGAKGKIGNGFSLSGVSGLAIPDTGAGSPIDFTTAVTIELWMKPDAADQACGLVSKETNGMPLTGYTIAQNSSGAFFFLDVRADTRVLPAAPGGALVAGAWVHVAATYDGTAARLYRNGQFVATAATTGPIKANDQALTIGQSDYGVFRGALDEVKIWNVVRSEAEICLDAGGTGAGVGCVLP